MSAFAEKVKRFYDMGLYNKTMVHNFLLKGKITEEEYNQIVGGENG